MTSVNDSTECRNAILLSDTGSEEYPTNCQRSRSPLHFCSSAFIADWMQVSSVIESIMEKARNDELLLRYALHSLLIVMQGRGNFDPMMKRICGKGRRRWRSTWSAGRYAGKKCYRSYDEEEGTKTRRLLVGEKY